MGLLSLTGQVDSNLGRKNLIQERRIGTYFEDKDVYKQMGLGKVKRQAYV